MAGTQESSVHPWISYININPCSIYKVCAGWSAEVTVESQERRIISALRALNPVLQSEFDGTEVLWQAAREVSIPHNAEIINSTKNEDSTIFFIIP